MRAAYTGHEELTFPDYLDQDTGRTLTAVPGQSYDVVPASGHPVPDLPAGWFAPLDGEEPQAEESGESGEQEPESPPENPDEPQQF